MKFCTNCGKQLNDDAKFCDGCGTAVGSTGDGANRSIKFKDADIIKCPSCGQDGLSRFDTVCPSCGFKFESKERSKAIDELRALISNCNGNMKEQLNVIRNYNCPNNVQDMYELIIFSANQISTLKSMENDSVGNIFSLSFSIWFGNSTVTDYRNLQAAYLGIIKNIRDKVNIMFGNTAEGKRIYDLTAEIQQKATKEVHKMSKTKKFVMTYIIGIIALSVIVPAAIIIPTNTKKQNETKRLEAVYTNVTTLIENKDYEAAELALKDMIWTYDFLWYSSSEYKEVRNLWAGKKTELQNIIDERQGKKKTK